MQSPARAADPAAMTGGCTGHAPILKFVSGNLYNSAILKLSDVTRLKTVIPVFENYFCGRNRVMRVNKRAQIINKYFTYTKRERNGILVLIVIFALLQICIFVLHFLPDPSPMVMDAETRKMIALLNQKIREDKLKSKRDISFPSYAKRAVVKAEKVVPEITAPFDPNQLSQQGWEEMGLSEKQAASIVHWQEKGGRFRSREDLKKMWVISPENYRRMEPYLAIAPAPDHPKFASQRDSSRTPFQKNARAYPLVELNQADSVQLMKLPMIGEGRARSILKYRSMLGGFVSTEQLREVRNLPDSVRELIVPKVTVNPLLVRKLRINGDSADSLYHPYLPKAAARMMVQYRKEHGNYKVVEDLIKLPLFSDEILRKLAPYLTVN